MPNKLNGRFEEIDGIWWAYCDEPILAAHGKTPEEAFSGVIRMATLYYGTQKELQKSPIYQAANNNERPSKFEFALA